MTASSKALVCPALSVYNNWAGHKKDPMPLLEKSRALCPSGRIPPSFIHQVIMITGLKSYECMFSP